MKNSVQRRVAGWCAIGVLATGGVTAAFCRSDADIPPAPYDAHSAAITVGIAAGEHVETAGSCDAGYHVRGGYLDSDAAGVHEWFPAISLDEDNVNGEMYTHAPRGSDRSGGTTDQDETYRGFEVAVYNHSLQYTETTTVSWTCDPN